MYLNGRSPAVRTRLLAIPFEEMAVCSIVKAEMFYGAMRSNNPPRTLERQKSFLDQFASLPFSDETAVIFGRIRAHLVSIGTPIGAYDLQIAAIALANDLTLVTHNTGEFERVEGLQIEDWEAEA
jgi:tRNA(fMet)-specific endonuclease VapC